MVRSGVVAAIAAAACVLAPAATGIETPVPLPSPAESLSPSPPLRTTASLFELRLPGSVSTRQLVEVGLDAAGAPLSVRVRQRLTLEGKGDYSFSVQAPAIDVLPAPGTDSEPGLRRDAILWQGFSPGRRVLGSIALLRPAASGASLPLRVSVEARVDGRPLTADARSSGRLDLRLTIRNATAIRSSSYTGTGVPLELARILDRLRVAVESGGPLGQDLVHLVGGSSALRPAIVRVEAPLTVRGLVRFTRGRVEGLSVTGGRASPRGIAFRARLGDGAPLVFHVRARAHVRGVGSPVVGLEAAPVLALSTLRPARGRTWSEAVEHGLVTADGRSLLATTIVTVLRLARARQYEMFLANPDFQPRGGSDRTTYRFRTAPTRRAAAPAPEPEDGGGLLVPLVLVVSGVVAAGALVVGWAHL